MADVTEVSVSQIQSEPPASGTEKSAIETLNDQIRQFLKPADGNGNRLPPMTFANDPERPKKGEPIQLSPVDYTVAELQQRLDYAAKLVTRKVSPATWAFAIKYRAAAQAAIAAEIDEEPALSPEERSSPKEQVQTYDAILEYPRSLYYIPTEGMKLLLDSARQLQKMQLFATYRDYLPLSCKAVARAVKENEDLNPYHKSPFSEWWMELQKNIRKERDAETQKPDQKPPVPRASIVRAVKNCATTLKIDEEQLFRTVEQLYGKLANILHRDLCTVESLNADGNDRSLLYIRATIKRLVEHCFTYDTDEEHEPDTWTLTDVGRKQKRRKDKQQSEDPDRAAADVQFQDLIKTEAADEVESRQKWEKMLNAMRRLSAMRKAIAERQESTRT
ncbi:hypothetical protein A1O1_06883 [Capronia coronata CBS 617.96]|uniref:Uncharacterized protein n=1 Tax=Capronia coronata CBS 617.96 TaxID=1182541 RepID=W9YLX2_9EURO|nr:uncharacterized protein A1O1_06883 [Capronia coronata CBS 617.96]EXJ83264.1 hypothetical protein A1O1_06883 [Capronia coronata CBS 617.96]